MQTNFLQNFQIYKQKTWWWQKFREFMNEKFDTFFFFNKKNEYLYKKLALISPQVTKGWQTSLRKLTTLITRLHNLFWRFTFLEIHPLPPPSPHGLPLQRQEARESGVRMHNMEMQQTDSYSVITASHIYNIFFTEGKVERWWFC